MSTRPVLQRTLEMTDKTKENKIQNQEVTERKKHEAKNTEI